MASERTELDLITQEWNNYGTTWTHNEEFDRDGYYVVKNLWNHEELYHPLPPETGSFKWWGKKLDQFIKESEVEPQVEGSLARYNHPQYLSLIHI